MPEMTTAPASVSANSRNSEPVRPPVKASGANTAASVIVIATTAPEISRMPLERRLHRRHALLDMAMDVLDHDDGVVDHEADGEHHGEQGEEIDRIAERKRRKQTPISDSGIVTTGIITERNEPRKRKMTNTTISTASAMVLNTSSIEALINLVESYMRVMVMPGGRLAWIDGSSATTAGGGVERIGRRRREHADERARLCR